MKQSIGTIAHEGIHQILHNIGVQQRLSRGRCGFQRRSGRVLRADHVSTSGCGGKASACRTICGCTSSAGFCRPESGSGGRNRRQSGRRGRVAQLQRLRGRLVPDALPGLAAKGKVSETICATWPAWDRSSRQPAAPAPQHTAAVRQALWLRLSRLQAALVEHLQSLPYVDPIANQTHYVVLLDTTSMRTAGVTTSPSGAPRVSRRRC